MSRRLDVLREQLGDRDLDLLRVLLEHRFALTSQLSRTHRPRYLSAASALRQTSRSLKQMATLNLVKPLPRRIGGTRAGSASTVWSLTSIGAHVVGHRNVGRRHRLDDPSTTFLEHTVAVTELRVQLAELEHQGGTRIASIETEPSSWRHYLDQHGQPAILRPDLAVSLTTGQYEDHWFLETDRATETPARVIAACRRYQRYRATGIEQRRHEVFPAVAWVTPTEARAAQLRRHLDAAGDLDSRLFTVVSIQHFTGLMTTGPSS